MLAPLAALAVGCAPAGAPPGLFVPDTVELRWDDAWNAGQDGMVTLVPVDVMAYDAGTGAPLAGRRVSLDRARLSRLEDADVDALPVGAVHWRGALDGAEARDGEDAVWWDARRDAFFELDAGAEPAGPGPLEVATDHTGVARFYLLVDALPGEVPVTAACGDTEETFLLVPR